MKNDFDPIRKATRYHAARLATLRSLRPRGFSRESRYIVPAMASVREGWHRMIWQLQEAGWKPAQVARNIPYLLNCAPFGLKVKSRYTRFCDHPQICPFCWARRRVIDPFQALEQVLYGGLAPSGTVIGGHYHLLEFETRDFFEIKNKRGLHMSDCLQKVVDWVRSPSRCREVREVKNYGGFVNHRVELVEDRLVTYRAGVLLVGPGAKLPDCAGRSFTYHDEVKKKVLAAIFGRICRFPSSWWQAEPMDTKTMLEAFHRVRFSALHGEVRGAAARNEQQRAVKASVDDEE